MSVGGINPVYQFAPRWQTAARQARAEREEKQSVPKPDQLDLFDSVAMARDAQKNTAQAESSAAGKETDRVESSEGRTTSNEDQKAKETKSDENRETTNPADRQPEERPPPESPPARIDTVG